VWFRSIFLKTLRDYRIAILGWGIGMGLVIVSPMASVSTLIKTPEARAALLSLAKTFAWNADPVAADTIGGYATFKIGIFIFLICIWPLLVASRTLRGEEEHSSMDVLLSAPRSRVRVAVEKVAAIWAALALMGIVIGVVAYLGGRAFKAEFGIGGGLLFGLGLALLCAVIAGIALLISQFTQERGPAAGITAGLLLVFIVLDMVHRVAAGADWASQLSPIYYYNLSKPLVPGYGTSAGGMLVLLGLALVLNAVAVWRFARRDVGATVPLPRWLNMPVRSRWARAALPVDDWSLRTVYARSLAVIVTPTFWWTLGIAGFAAWMVSVVELLESKMSDLYGSSPALKGLLTRLGGTDASFNATFLSAMFVFVPLLLMAFAVTQVNRWAADEGDGRLDLVLSAPQSRVSVVLGRFGALATATVFIALISLAASLVAASASGLALDTGNLAAAAFGAIPVALLVAAIGYLGAGWLRTAADTGLLSFILVIWFFLSFIGPELKLPDATLRMSVFYYYGTPLVHGLQVADMLGLVVVGAVVLGLGVLRFARKDIAI